MAIKIRAQKDFNAGLMFIVLGAAFLIIAAGVPGMPNLPGYSMGTAVRMGPAYFPTILGGILVALGVIVFLRAFASDEAPPAPTKWRPLLWILGSVILFGALVGTAGIIFATVTIVLVSAFGGHEFYWKEQLIEATILTIGVVAIFSYGLGLPFKLWPWSF